MWPPCELMGPVDREGPAKETLESRNIRSRDVYNRSEDSVGPPIEKENAPCGTATCNRAA